MSYVTGVVMQCSVAEDFVEAAHAADDTYPLLDEIDAWLAERRLMPLVRVTKYAPRGKHPQINILCGGYNYFPTEEFIGFVTSRPWRCPEQMCLLTTTEDEPTRLSRPSGTSEETEKS